MHQPWDALLAPQNSRLRLTEESTTFLGYTSSIKSNYKVITHSKITVQPTTNIYIQPNKTKPISVLEHTQPYESAPETQNSAKYGGRLQIWPRTQDEVGIKLLEPRDDSVWML